MIERHWVFSNTSVIELKDYVNEQQQTCNICALAANQIATFGLAGQRI